MPSPPLNADERALLADLVERAANTADPGGPWGIYLEPPNRGPRASNRPTRHDWLVMLRPLGEDPRSLVYASPCLYDALHDAWQTLSRPPATAI